MQRYIGKDIGYVEAHFPKDVNECLGTDFRTIRVDNFEYEEVMTDKGLGLKCSCVIWSIYGSKPYETTIQI